MATDERTAKQAEAAADLGNRGAKGFLSNLSEAGQRVTFLFNPVQFTESYEAMYARKASPGLSHERLQFLGNKNARIPLDLVFDEFHMRRNDIEPSEEAGEGTFVAARTKIAEVKRFFLAALYPRRSQRLLTASPPALLFVWPGEISMRVRVMKVQFKNTMFASRTSNTRRMTVSVDLEEDVEQRIYSQAIFGYGGARPWATSDRPRRRGS